MLKRLMFPTAAFFFLLGSISVSPGVLEGQEDPECNNKVCDSEQESCIVQTGGPDTHCLDDEVTCLWDTCEPD